MTLDWWVEYRELFSSKLLLYKYKSNIDICLQITYCEPHVPTLTVIKNSYHSHSYHSDAYECSDNLLYRDVVSSSQVDWYRDLIDVVRSSLSK